ncbi:fumarylacetoacetate hydrolase family protein [Psychrobacter aestuarii]|uniref:Fumarylacetoacetate hydrolase family protein n=1 Tax=Psychrobacter aestuarii TaxID=556327 RepID=A0ABP3FBK4_9GAMM|nr:fumarylacetoacetate hydrolase family protein [Psychrobacter aestuarii]
MSQSPHQSLANAIAAGNPESSETAAHKQAVGKVVCVGRNYAAHAEELGNSVPSTPMLFMKPASSIAYIHRDADDNVVVRPDAATYGETHYEAELCVRLAKDLCRADVSEAAHAVGAVTLGLDLTLRELQSALKDKGYPWERAKCFDGACVLADWVAPEAFGDLRAVHYQLHINDALAQDGDTSLMLFSVYELLADISHAFSLKAGDVVMTGTPSGVGVLHAGDNLRLTLGEHGWHAVVK